MDAMIQSFHEQLPPSVQATLSFVLLEHWDHADYYLSLLVVLLTGLLVVQSRAFSRPPPVPLKQLPKRPMVQFLFKPDDTESASTQNPAQQGESGIPNDDNERSDTASNWRRRLGRMRQRMTRSMFRRRVRGEDNATFASSSAGGPKEDTLESRGGSESDVDSEHGNIIFGDSDDLEDLEEENDDQGIRMSATTDLPDSFAPLLSSSQVQVLTDQLSADLIHAIQVKAEVRLRPGRHEIPLDIDKSRPQFILDIPPGGCRISAVGAVGSDGFSPDQDLDASLPTNTRSKPMVKHAGIVLDPPLPLSNVAPTLIHFPTLFEDNFVPTLRRIQIVRYVIDFVVSMSSFLEKCLWIIETKCQVHLSKVRITPIYKGSKNSSPDWRLSLSFSGHVLLFGYLPIPFISVVLPTFIIPQPHALLDKLLTKQPLASAKLHLENIDEERIVLAAIDATERWSTDVQIVATPPAAGVDITFPGGATMALKLGLGRDTNGDVKPLSEIPDSGGPGGHAPTRPPSSDDSMSTFSTQVEHSNPVNRRRRFRRREQQSSAPPYDANHVVPWSLRFKAKGSVSREKMTLRVVKCTALQDSPTSSTPSCKFDTTGSFAIWKVDPKNVPGVPDSSPHPLRRRHSRGTSWGSHPLLEAEESPPVSAILLFPDETTSFHRDLRMLEYDYAFEVSDDTRIDSVTLSVGASHPMLKGDTSLTVILESLYSYGSVGARENAVLDPMERRRKRNVLRHLPAVDFTLGVENVYIPPESRSYSDDGQTLFLPDLEGGRIMARVLGGIHTKDQSETPSDAVYEGVKVIADFEVSTLNLTTQGNMKEFPELDIFEGVKLRTKLAGIIGGSISAHLRPQHFDSLFDTTGRNVFNPLEAYEIEFSGSNISVKMKEFTAALGHRRIIFPTESTFVINVIESVVDMGFEGRTQCDLSWDFQGLSPILQVTSLDQTPEDAVPESKQQVSLLISPLRFGRISFHVSSVGGIQIKKAATSREDKEGLYDWKFFNALVSPDETSMKRIIDVIHDKRTMEKLLQVIHLINVDLHKLLKYLLQQVWRAKDILDAEGVSDPGNAIPMFKMARLITLFLTGDIKEIGTILPIARKVVVGEGLDVVKVKELLRNHLDFYEQWAPELDRAVRWAELMLGPVTISPNFVEENVKPLAELPQHASRLRGIPSATELYERILDKPKLPLEPSFSNLIGRVAPYLSFRQIEFLLQARSASDWQQADLRRLRYVFSIKRKVLDIAESYGGLSFLPQSFLVSVFLGEATRSSLRAPTAKFRKRYRSKAIRSTRSISSVKSSNHTERYPSSRNRTPGWRSGDQDTFASRFLPISDVSNGESISGRKVIPSRVVLNGSVASEEGEEYEMGDSLLGPQDVAIVLQSGLTSVMKGSTVVQLNQRMLLDLICSQPRSFAIAVLAEIGTPSGQGSPRSLTSALMALLELDQTAFKADHQVDMHVLLESWLPGVRIPRRGDYMAGGRWARQSYYEAIFAVSKSILDDAETYVALKGHIQRSRRYRETDPLPVSKEESAKESSECDESRITPHLRDATNLAKRSIEVADAAGAKIAESLIQDETVKKSAEYTSAVEAYREAFDGCAKVVSLDKYAFQAPWLSSFYKRNYDALMMKSLHDNVVGDVDKVRHWLHALRNGSVAQSSFSANTNSTDHQLEQTTSGEWEQVEDHFVETDTFFLEPEKHSEQEILDAIIEAMIYNHSDREVLRQDPLVRLLIPNPSEKYNFMIVSAMGVITEGERGLELNDAFKRLEDERGVQVIRADTGTARSFEYNASKIEDAIREAAKLQKPFGLLGYSQGCANALMTETILLSGTPSQRDTVTSPQTGLVCRQLLFSAANGSAHGPAMERKIQRLIIMCEEFFKYQQGYVSRALASSVLETLNNILDSSDFHKMIGGAQSFLPDGCRAFWREAQHLGHVPTCTLRGVLEQHTTPESLEMISHLLTKQSGSPLHDSQVHAFDAVGYPVYHRNRNGNILKRCAVGEGTIQRTHHWSPLSDEVEFVRTARDVKFGCFECAKDRHVFPWVEVNARFGFIKPMKTNGPALPKERHPKAMMASKKD